jgi:hypothetical protein
MMKKRLGLRRRQKRFKLIDNVWDGLQEHGLNRHTSRSSRYYKRRRSRPLACGNSSSLQPWWTRAGRRGKSRLLARRDARILPFPSTGDPAEPELIGIPLTHEPLGNASLTVGPAPIALATFFPAGHTGGAWSCVFVSLVWNQGGRWAPLRTCPRHFFQTV